MLGVLNEYPQVAVAGGLQLELGDAYAGERRGSSSRSTSRTSRRSGR